MPDRPAWNGWACEPAGRRGAGRRRATREGGGHMNAIHWDSWDPGYGATVDADGPSTDSTADIEPGVEVPATKWEPRQRPAERVDVVVFVDGVLRNDARGW